MKITRETKERLRRLELHDIVTSLVLVTYLPARICCFLPRISIKITKQNVPTIIVRQSANAASGFVKRLPNRRQAIPMQAAKIWK
jgi:hypothetical protein